MNNRTDKDAPVRAILAGQGDNGSVPRHTLFYFYGGDFVTLGVAASATGYKTRPTADNDGIVLETMISVDEVTFKVRAERMEAWAEEFRCKYDRCGNAL